ncbi:hypothetical protein EJB05_39391, partial [Eragrostis curvula]
MQVPPATRYDLCRPPLNSSSREDRDRDDDDFHAPARRHWRDLTCRGRSGMPRDDAHVYRQRTRSPQHYRRRNAAAEEPLDDDWQRGRHVSRSPPSPRTRKPQRRDDEGWDRRRSRSPTRRSAALQIQGSSWTAACFGTEPSEEREAYPVHAPPPPNTHPDPLLDLFQFTLRDLVDPALTQAT